MGVGTPRASVPIVFVPPGATPTFPPTAMASARPTRTPAPTATPGAADHLLDPGFEQGFTYWTPGGYPELTSVAPTGTTSVRLGGYDNADGAVFQPVTIPACATGGMISNWLYPYGTATREGLSDKVRV